MALNDTITTIEAEVAPETIQAEPEVIVPATPEPQVHQAPASPIIQMAIDQAAYRLARETAK